MIRSTAAWKSVIRRGYVASRGRTRASRPHMPDYGILARHRGIRLLPWSWAVEQLHASKNFWVATVWPDGRPHLSAVWGVWLDDAAWFSCGLHARKLINLRGEPRCAIATDDSNNPLVVDGVAEVIIDRALIRAVSRRAQREVRERCHRGLPGPRHECQPCASRPVTAFAIRHDDFHGSPTRWSFAADEVRGAASSVGWFRGSRPSLETSPPATGGSSVTPAGCRRRRRRRTA